MDIYKKPNLFIVGAPKSGTTSLAYYLSCHQDIFISDPKEPHFFATDLPKYRKMLDKQEYINLFKNAPQKVCYLGEASPNYLRSKEALNNILEFNPDSHFIVMLRNPVDLAVSWHSHLVVLKEEERADFLCAWRCKSPPNYEAARDPKDLAYNEVTALGDQLEKLFALADRERVYVIFFDKFKEQTSEVFNDLISWLNLPSAENPPDFTPLNQRKVAKNRLLQKAVNVGPNWAGPLWREIRKRPLLREAVRKLVLKREKPIPHEQRAELRNSFLPQMRKIEYLTQISLERWKNEK